MSQNLKKQKLWGEINENGNKTGNHDKSDNKSGSDKSDSSSDHSEGGSSNSEGGSSNSEGGSSNSSKCSISDVPTIKFYNHLNEFVKYGEVVLANGSGTEADILKAARLSYNMKDRDLIRFIMRNQHWSPFEHVSFTFLITCPIFVAKLFKHETSDIEDLFYWPSVFTNQSLSMPVQFNEMVDIQDVGLDLELCAFDTINIAYNTYRTMLNAGISREQARAVLPANTMSKFYFTMDLRNLLHFIKSADAQPEVQSYIMKISEVIQIAMPTVWEAFQDFSLNTVTLTALEVELLQSLNLKLNIPADARMTHSEIAEFQEKLKKLFNANQ